MKWRYYNHAMIPETPPHIEADTAALNDGSVWMQKSVRGGVPLLARWTSDFDCGYETNWWYVIKDDIYDISKMKAKRRYEITKARKNFEIRVILPKDYREELYKVQVEAFQAYPEKYRPSVEYDDFINECETWTGVCIGAFSRKETLQSTELCGYAYLIIEGKCINFSVQKTRPQYERYGVNAALVDGVLLYFADELEKGKYICDGARSINHETAFQDYLEKYFGFRKAYCRLQIKYRPGMGWLIKLLYRFRNVLKRFDDVGIIHQVNAVMIMEEIKRKCYKSENK